MASVLLVALTTTRADAAAPATCQQGPGPCVVVEVVDGQSVVDRQEYSVDQINGGDVQQATVYPLSGGGSVTITHGTTLSALAAQAQTGGKAITYAEVVAPDAYGRHPLTTTNLGPAGANGFQGGLQPAFYSYGTGVMSYIRPQRSSDDQNNTQGPDAGNLFSDPGGGGALTLVLHTSGRLIDVAVTAQPADGSDRSWTLSTDQPASSTFDWVLPDQSHQSTATAAYAFRATDGAGTYPVAVAVDTADGSFGWGSTTLRAGAAPAPTASASATGTGGKGKASTGPTKRPSSTASGPPRPGSSDGTGTPAPTTGATSTPSSAPSLPPATGSIAPTSAPSREPSRTPSRTPSATPTPMPPGESVSGILLANGAPVEPVDPSSAPTLSDPPATSEAAAPIVARPFGVPVAVPIALGGLLLLALGALSESERVRARLRRWARMGA